MATEAAQHVRGYWGAPDALHQFCEPHYATSFYIAEFWNSLSSFIFIAIGVYGLSHPQVRADAVMVMMFVSLIIVGAGSIAFHATMLYKYELWDELPMLFYMCCCLLAKEDTIAKATGVLCCRIGILGILVGSIAGYLMTAIYEVFVATFTVLVVVDTGLALTWSSDQREAIWARNAAMASITSARVFWEIEVRTCADNPHVWPLHILWHAFSALAAYYSGIGCLCNKVDCSPASSRGDVYLLNWVLFPYDRVLSTTPRKAA